MASTVALRKWHVGLLAAVVCFGSGAAASDLQPRAGVWRPVGPFGGSVGAVAVAPSDPRVLYVCGGGTIFRSRDGGINWTWAGASAPTRTYGPIAVSPANPDTVFAGSSREGIVRSDDAGATWRDARQGLPTYTNSSVYYDLWSIAIDPSAPDIVIAGVIEQGVYRSVDGGRTWMQVIAADPAHNPYYFDAVFEGAVPGSAFASGSALFGSADHGAHWHRVASLPGQVTKLAVGPEGDGTLYALAAGTTHRLSLESGGGWENISTSLARSSVWTFAVDPTRPGALFAASTLWEPGWSSAVFETTDAGAQWREVGRLPRGGFVADILADPSASGALWVTDDNRGFYRRYAGVDFFEAANQGLHATQAVGLARDPFDARVLYGAFMSAGFFRSRDGGSTWQRCDTGIPGDQVTAVLPDPAVPGTLYLGTAYTGVKRSVDGGETWTPISDGTLGRVTYLAIDPRSSKTIFAFADTGIWKTTDGGRTWARKSAQLRSYDLGGTRLVLDPRAPNEIFESSWKLFKSTDAGETWNESGAGLPYAPYICDPESCPDRVWALALDPFRANTLYAATEYNGVWVSEDRAATWKAAGPVEPKTRSIIADPVRPGTLYVGTAGKGVFRSTDFGATWSPLGEGLGPVDVWSLVLHASGERVFAGTAGAGVFVLDVPRTPRRALRFLTPGSRTGLLAPRN